MTLPRAHFLASTAQCAVNQERQVKTVHLPGHMGVKTNGTRILKIGKLCKTAECFWVLTPNQYTFPPNKASYFIFVSSARPQMLLVDRITEWE